MNPWFAQTGVPRTSGVPYFGYATVRPPDLVESALVESVGIAAIGAAPFRTKWYCPSGALRTSSGTAYGPIDWNCDGVVSGTVAVNVTGPKSPALTRLVPRNDWTTLAYGGGTLGGPFA